MKRSLSHFILILQILSFLFILVTGTLLPSEPVLLFPQIFAVGFAFWGVYTLWKKSKFSAFIETPENATLITSGPFEYIRHPVYSGILLFSLISILTHFTLIRTTALLILTIITVVTLHKEEDHLANRFGKYDHYQKKTKKLIPFLY